MSDVFDWESFYAARAQGDAEKMLSFFHQSAVVEFVGLGRQIIRLPINHGDAEDNLTNRIAKEFLAAFQWLEYQVDSFVQNGNDAFARISIELFFKPHRTTAKMEICQHLRLMGNRIAAVTEFADTALVEQLVSPPGQASVIH